MKTLYVSDLDGTLMNSGEALSDFTRETVNRLVAGGFDFTLATARSIASARPVIQGLKLKIPAVMMNGVFLTDIATERQVHVNYFEPELAKRVIDAFIDNGRPPLVYSYADGIDVEYTEVRTDYEADFIAERKRRYRTFEPVERYSLDRNIVYINSIDLPEAIRPVYDAVAKIEGVSQTMYPDNYSHQFYFLETFSASAGKWNGVRQLKELYGYDRVVVFGDNLNDLEMLRKADVGIAVRNGHPEAVAAADVVIGSNDEDSVARYLLKAAEA